MTSPEVVFLVLTLSFSDGQKVGPLISAAENAALTRVALEAAEDARLKGDTARVVHLMEETLLRDPACGKCHLLIASAKLGTRDYVAAENPARLALQLLSPGSDRTFARAMLRNILRRLGRPQEAEQVFKDWPDERVEAPQAPGVSPTPTTPPSTGPVGPAPTRTNPGEGNSSVFNLSGTKWECKVDGHVGLVMFRSDGHVKLQEIVRANPEVMFFPEYDTSDRPHIGPGVKNDYFQEGGPAVGNDRWETRPTEARFFYEFLTSVFVFTKVQNGGRLLEGVVRNTSETWRNAWTGRGRPTPRLFEIETVDDYELPVACIPSARTFGASSHRPRGYRWGGL